jgi:excisionase family DNA binding protein
MKKEKTTVKQHLSPLEAARILKTDRAYIYALISLGRLPAMRQDGKWLIPSVEVEKRRRIHEAGKRCTLKAINHS